MDIYVLSYVSISYIYVFCCSRIVYVLSISLCIYAFSLAKLCPLAPYSIVSLTVVAHCHYDFRFIGNQETPSWYIKAIHMSIRLDVFLELQSILATNLPKSRSQLRI